MRQPTDNRRSTCACICLESSKRIELNKPDPSHDAVQPISLSRLVHSVPFKPKVDACLRN